MSFYFYDLETSGIDARAQRIMQFAGQRTDDNLQPIGEPHNWLVRLSDEILPDPEAVLLTGITPQKTLEEGYTEAEFLQLFMQQVATADTIIVGYNNIRFDDEFMRNTLWRNFYDAYEWQWRDGRSRWDLLDVVRMVRALRPKGIEWPVDSNGNPTNRLELLTKANNLDHDNAHDALSDVSATIAVAQLLRDTQPKMFDYLLSMHDKKQLLKFLNPDDPQPFVYTSGRYSNKWQKTTVAVPIAPAQNSSLLVYDLRQDPAALRGLSDEKLGELLFSRHETTEILPVKVLKPNACPAVAPIGVFDEACQQRLGLAMQTINDNFKKLFATPELIEKISQLYELNAEERKKSYDKITDADGQLYDGFINDRDKKLCQQVVNMSVDDLSKSVPDFSDARLSTLLPRYKAKNFSKIIDATEREAWEEYRNQRLLEGVRGQLSLGQYLERLRKLSETKRDDNQQYLLQELSLWAESIAPLD